MEAYRSLSSVLQARYGCKVYKLALQGGMTCPNRDGTCGWGGCVFCGPDGSGAFAQNGQTVWAQIEAAKARVAGKIHQGRYIAYFQDHTNTYAPRSYLEPLFRSAISHPDVVALSIATRPDCLPPDVLALLEELNREKPIWVELGLQTIHPQTTAYIRRGYPLPVYDHAAEALRARGIEVITHVILGLPGEDRQAMLETVRYAGARTDGIKLHLLHVLRDTVLAADYAAGHFETLSLEAYCGLVADCLRVLPPQVVIHRLTGDGAKKDLIAPLWSGNKKLVLNTIRRTLAQQQVRQGQWADLSPEEWPDS